MVHHVGYSSGQGPDLVLADTAARHTTEPRYRRPDSRHDGRGPASRHGDIRLHSHERHPRRLRQAPRPARLPPQAGASRMAAGRREQQGRLPRSPGSTDVVGPRLRGAAGARGQAQLDQALGREVRRRRRRSQLLPNALVLQAGPGGARRAADDRSRTLGAAHPGRRVGGQGRGDAARGKGAGHGRDLRPRGHRHRDVGSGGPGRPPACGGRLRALHQPLRGARASGARP